MAEAIFINNIQVAENKDEEFLKEWRSIHQYMKKQPGYISTKLHKSLKSDAHYRFINIAKFENPESFVKAINTDEFKVLAKYSPFEKVFSLYQVFETDE